MKIFANENVLLINKKIGTIGAEPTQVKTTTKPQVLPKQAINSNSILKVMDLQSKNNISFRAKKTILALKPEFTDKIAKAALAVTTTIAGLGFSTDKSKILNFHVKRADEIMELFGQGKDIKEISSKTRFPEKIVAKYIVNDPCYDYACYQHKSKRDRNPKEEKPTEVCKKAIADAPNKKPYETIIKDRQAYDSPDLSIKNMYAAREQKEIINNLNSNNVVSAVYNQVDMPYRRVQLMATYLQHLTKNPFIKKDDIASYYSASQTLFTYPQYNVAIKTLENKKCCKVVEKMFDKRYEQDFASLWGNVDEGYTDIPTRGLEFLEAYEQEKLDDTCVAAIYEAARCKNVNGIEKLIELNDYIKKYYLTDTNFDKYKNADNYNILENNYINIIRSVLSDNNFEALYKLLNKMIWADSKETYTMDEIKRILYV